MQAAKRNQASFVVILAVLVGACASESEEAATAEPGASYGRFSAAYEFPGSALEPVRDPEEFPYAAVVRVFRDGFLTLNGYGSGVLVSENVVLTAAHVLYDCEENGERDRDDFTVTPAQGEDSAPFGEYRVADWYVNPQFVEHCPMSEGSQEFPSEDWALVLLDGDPGWRTGWLPVLAVNDVRIFLAEVTAAGYPTEIWRAGRMQDTSTEQMYSAEGHVDEPDPLVLGHEVSIEAGMSGGPLWVGEEGETVVVGVQSTHAAACLDDDGVAGCDQPPEPDPSRPVSNYACRMSPARVVAAYQKIADWNSYAFCRGWTCGHHYGVGDGCDCGCGCPDPDCWDPAQPDNPCPGGVCGPNWTCVSVCSDECDVAGQSACWGQGAVQTCADHDGDACLEWSEPEPCPAGPCVNDACTTSPICRDHSRCTEATNGQRVCEDGGWGGYCRDEDGNGCLEYVDRRLCREGYCTPSGCATTCESTCTPGAALSCATAYATTSCEETEADCWTLVPHPCPSGQQCQSNRCTAPCSNDCPAQDAQQCTSSTMYRLCSNLDTDTCLEWSSPRSCSSDQRCDFVLGHCVGVPPAWWCTAINDLQHRGILTHDCSYYHGDETFNRAEWAKVLGTALNVASTPAYTNCRVPFTDVPPDAWYTHHVATLAFLARTDATTVFDPTQTLFRPGDPVRRCEAVKTIVEAWGLPASSAGISFSDMASIPSWCLPYLRAAVAGGVVVNRAEPFGPDRATTVGEGATMVSNAMGEAGRPTPTPSDFSDPSCGGGTSGCQDECTLPDCTDATHLRGCTDSDGDGCLERGAVEPCPAGQACVDWRCQTAIQCGDGDCMAGETCSSCPADCGVCAACGDGDCSGAESCTTCPGDCGACEVLVAGQITSPAAGSTVSNVEFLVNWTPGRATNGAATGTALLCQINGGIWERKVGFGFEPPYTMHPAGPGIAITCKVRTRLNSNYDVWIDSATRTWYVSSDYPAFVVTGVTIRPSPPPNGCEDLYFDATFRNNGSQRGTWRARGFLHAAGTDETAPEAVETWWSQNIDLGPGESGGAEFRIDLPGPLPLAAGTSELTVIIEDAYNDFHGTAARMTVPAVGTDAAAPTIEHFKVWGWDTTPVQVVPGHDTRISLTARDDYAVDEVRLSWRRSGGSWQPIAVAEQPSGWCRDLFGTSAIWAVPNDLPAGALLDVRLQADDAGGHTAERVTQVVARATGTPFVEFIRPVGGERYLQADEYNNDCIPVEFVFGAGAPIDSVKIRWANAEHTHEQHMRSVNPLPADGHVDMCIRTSYAGDSLEIVVLVEDVNSDEFRFYSEPVRVDFRPPRAPWGPVVATASSDVPNGVSRSFYRLTAEDGEAAVFQIDGRAWEQSSTWYSEVAVLRRAFDLVDFEPRGDEVVLPPYSQVGDPNSGASPRFLKPWKQTDRLVLAYSLQFNCDGDYCDSDFYYREVAAGNLTPQALVRSYPHRHAFDRPWLRHFVVSPGGTRFLFASNSDYQASRYHNDLFRETAGGGWTFLATIPNVLPHAFFAEGQLYGVGVSCTEAGDCTYELFQIAEATGAIQSAAAFLTFGPDRNLHTFLALDEVDQRPYLFTFDYTTRREFSLRTLEAGAWVLLREGAFETEWQGQPVTGVYPQSLFASAGRLFLFADMSAGGVNYRGGIPFSPDEGPTLVGLYRDIYEGEAETLAFGDDGLLVRAFACGWNLDSTLCLQRGHDWAGGDCFDGDRCTDDRWDVEAGTCTHVSRECPQDDLCLGPLACDPATGECVGDPLAVVECDDGSFCNGAESCDPATGLCEAGRPPTLSDGIACTADTCDEDTDSVRHEPLDENCVPEPCMSARCLPAAPDAEPQTGCVQTPAPPLADGLACTIDGCDPQTGQPVYEVASGFCLVDGLCWPAGTPNPQAPCQACDPAERQRAFSPAFEGEPCDDARNCMLDDRCVAGRCLGTPMNCDLVATDLRCQAVRCDDAALTCEVENLAEGTACDDEDYCNGRETCSAGRCVPGTPPNLQQLNACASETCDPAYGIRVETDDALCSAGGDPCAASRCDAQRGCVATLADGDPCDDENLCTASGTCSNGTCQGAPVDCHDGNQCTVDGCDPGSGCFHTFVIQPCDDGDPCTLSLCGEGRCIVTERLEGCCGRDADCDEPFERCSENACQPVHCLSCIDDSDCGTSDNRCVELESGRHCLVSCRRAGAYCPDLSTCEVFDDGSWLCQPFRMLCNCTPHESMTCAHGNLIWLSSCGEPEETAEDCGGRGCVQDACCPPGSWSDGSGACTVEPGPERVPDTASPDAGMQDPAFPEVIGADAGDVWKPDGPAARVDAPGDGASPDGGLPPTRRQVSTGGCSLGATADQAAPGLLLFALAVLLRRVRRCRPPRSA